MKPQILLIKCLIKTFSTKSPLINLLAAIDLVKT